MKRALFASFLGATLLVTAACKAKPDDKEAIRAGVVKYLGSLRGLNVANMDIVVTQATVDGSQAQAQVEIRAKSGDGAGGMMQLAYSLEKRGDEWVVVKSQPAGGTLQHPAPGEMPAGGAMPPGHPSVDGSSGQPVHSDLKDMIKSAQPPAQQPAAQPATPPPATGKP